MAGKITKINTHQKGSIMLNNIPDGLPTLTKGWHTPDQGEACVMEYVSILAGEEFSDSPHCTNWILAAAAREINDHLNDEDRHVLVPLIGRLFGTSETSDEIERALYDALPVEEGSCSCFSCRIADRVGTDRIASRAGSYYDPEKSVQILSDLIDVYDRVTGRTEHCELSTEELRELAAAVVPAA
jgi:hypothetical protein